MTHIAIHADRLGKQYRIVECQQRYRTLREALCEAFVAPARHLRTLVTRQNGQRRGSELFWALRDVSLEIPHGEVVGIIGRNGAGKSTLLKLLSRITTPTEGRALLKGRVGSLLEVGTGFHAELTGRENIYLNGAILGMKRREISRKFDEIVAFAEVERFIDTPVKHYSSGMYLRLAFAVAAHLDPEILLVDEVLAVGDAAFQKKCMGKMSDAAHQGRTVLLVSHNMAAIHTMARSCLVISDGRIVHHGGVAEAVRLYTGLLSQGCEMTGTSAQRAGRFQFRKPLDTRWDVSRPFYAEWDIPLPSEISSAVLWSILSDSNGARIIQEPGLLRDAAFTSGGTRTWTIGVHFPPVWLKPGLYYLQLRVFPNGLGKNQRYLSDPVPLELVADRTDVADTILAPTVQWEINSNLAELPIVVN